MADEISSSINFSLTNGGVKLGYNESVRITQGTKGGLEHYQTIGTIEEALVTGDVTTPGVIVLHNLDDENYVQWGPDNAGTMVVCGRIKPGDHARFYLDSGTTLKLQANTASCRIRILIAEA